MRGMNRGSAAKSRSIKKNFLYNATYQLIISLTPLITTPYLARVLGPNISGVYSFTYSIANYFAIFITLGVSTHGVRAIARCGDDRQLRSRTFWGVYSAQLLAGIPISILYALYCFTMHAGGMLVASVWGLYVLYAALDVSWLLFGCEEFKIPTVRSIITRLLMVASILLLVRTPDDLWLYCLSTAGAYFLNALLVWPFVRRYIGFERPALREVVFHFRANVALFVPVVAYSLYTTINDVMLGAFSTIDQVAYYDYSYKISRTFLHVITALGTVMLPRMSRAFTQGDRQGGLELLETSMWVMFVGAFALLFGIAAIAPDFIPIFFGQGYDACISLTTFLSILIPVVTITNVIGKQYLLPLGRDFEYTKSILAGALANVVLAGILIPGLGAWGAAIGTVAADFAILFVQLHSVRGELPFFLYLKGSLPFVLAGSAMFFIVRAVSLTTRGLNPLLALIVEVSFGALAYTMLVIFWCVRSRNKHFYKLFGNYVHMISEGK